MDKQKKLRVFYSDISALRDRSDQPQLWEFLCCARQQKIKQCKNEDDRLRAFGAGLLLEYGLLQLCCSRRSHRYCLRVTILPQTVFQ